MVLVEFVAESSVLVAAVGETGGGRLSVKQVTLAPAHEVTVVFAASGDDVEGLDAGLAADETVTAARRLSGDRVRYYRVRVADPWRLPVRAVYGTFVTLDGVLLDATVVPDGWEVQARFPDREAVSAFRNRCREFDLPLSVRKLSRLEDPLPDVAVTRPQREALVVAYEAGYFDVPRAVTMEELAECLGVSPQAVSARLRRGHANLVRTALLGEGP